MPKKTKLPRFRVHIRKGKEGQVNTYYYFDMRPEGKPDIKLGTDRDVALSEYKRLMSGEATNRGLVSEAISRWLEQELPKYTVPKTRMDYGRQARRIDAWCGRMRWEQVTLPAMVKYLDVRKAKTQANREMALLSIVWGCARKWGMTKLMWPAMGVKNWKNAEQARHGTLDMEVFDAVYLHADQLLRDAMDLASATGVRLTDARAIKLPDDDRIELVASKTGKIGWFDARKSAVLPGILQRRRAVAANHPLLLTASDGLPVTENALSYKWGIARNAAASVAKAAGNTELADRISKAWLKDSRKLAANLAESTEQAGKLLQHSSLAVTRKHYRSAADELDPSR